MTKEKAGRANDRPQGDEMPAHTIAQGTLIQEAPSSGVRDVELVPADAGLTPLFERLATDPNASVEKIERLMALWERNEARKAESAFNIAMSAAQKKMRPIVADDYNPQTQSKFASFEALDTAIRPIYTEEGFGLSFNTAEAPGELQVRMLCYVSHRGGYTRTYHLDMPADGKGAKGGDVMTKTHATGSALSYGQRYLLRMIFNLAVAKDDDGNQAGTRLIRQARQPQPPPKYDEQWTDLCAAADEGTAAYEKAWAAMSGAFKNYTIEHRKDQRNALTARAAAVTKAKL